MNQNQNRTNDKKGSIDVDMNKTSQPREGRLPGEGSSGASHSNQQAQGGGAKQNPPGTRQQSGSQSSDQAGQQPRTQSGNQSAQQGGSSGQRTPQQSQQSTDHKSEKGAGGTAFVGNERLAAHDDPEHGKLVTEDPDRDDDNRGNREATPRKPGSGPDE